MTETYKTIHTRRDIPIRVNIKESLEDIIAILDGCYSDIFANTRQKFAAWQYWLEWTAKSKGISVDSYRMHNVDESRDSFYGELFYFLFNAPVKAEFIKFCAKKEKKNPVEYILSMLEI